MRIRTAICVSVLLAAAVVQAFPQAQQTDTAAAPAAKKEKTYSEDEAREFLKIVDAESQRRSTQFALAEWGYASNITEETLKIKLQVSADNARYQKEIWKETIKYPYKTFSDPDLKRQFEKLSVLGAAALDDAKFERVETLISEMQSTYSTAKICDYKDKNKCDLNLEPELTVLLARSRNPDELRHIWTEFRKNAGDKVRSSFTEYIALLNEGARLNNFPDASEEWVKDYEAADFRDQVSELWKQLRPLYEHLHAFVRTKLRQKYGEEVVSKDGPIPAHLLGNMWAQTWSNIDDITTPFPGKQAVDVTDTMVAKGYTPLKMFQMADEFFTSLNLTAMPETFWKNSILEKPEGRNLVCHASAWDFYDTKDFRIKQCTQVNMEQLMVAHHEMGHVEYFLQYRNQPYNYREGSNPGFHEAVGDTIALSVGTPKHLKKVGLLPPDSKDDPESDINHLFNVGLDKIAFLPFGYLMDLWRWDVFKGRTTEQNYNCEWWKLRHEYQGIEPPVDRSEDNFDPGSKYHIIASVPYIRYFVSFVIQFQFHRALCEKAGQFDPANPERLPLHQCDIYQSKEAGNLLGKMLQMGASKPWPDAMEVITGQRKMDASALLQYFMPLQKWLEEQNKKSGEKIGWGPPRHVCKSTKSSDGKAAAVQRDAPAAALSPTPATEAPLHTR